MAEPELEAPCVIAFGYDFETQLAFVRQMHLGDDVNAHPMSQVLFAWEQVPLLVERISQLFLLLDQQVTIFESLVKDGIPVEAAKEKAVVMAQREREIGET